MEDSIISHSNGMSSAMPNLIIMTDSQDNFHQNLPQKSQNQTCKSRGMFQCRSDEAQCYNFLQICDHVCDCTKDCIDENQCLETLSLPSPWPWAEKSETSLILQGNILGSIVNWSSTAGIVVKVSKVHIFWEGHKILRNLHHWFVLWTASQIIGGYFAKFCSLLRIYELYLVSKGRLYAPSKWWH